MASALRIQQKEVTLSNLLYWKRCHSHIEVRWITAITCVTVVL